MGWPKFCQSRMPLSVGVKLRKTSSVARLLIILLVLSALTACHPTNEVDSERLVKIDLESELLHKNMQLLIWLPKDMSEDQRYPVLYFLPDYGGSAYTVIHVYEIGKAADELVQQGLMEPMIIVAVSMDRSFGLNTASDVRTVELESGKTISEGPYEDFFVTEVIPLIDSRFATRSTRSGRMIGGYSMGGFAALHLAFRHADLFSRAGGHSATLFKGGLPDKAVSDWLYPNEMTRDSRDPIRLAQANDLDGLAVYLDTGEMDPNLEGNAMLAEILQKKQVYCENHLFPGVHSRSYCQKWMKEYLTFYGAAPP